MKKIFFTKMVGAGNDFIIVESQKGLNYKNLAFKVCDRTDGIGADGLIVLDKSKKADYKMRIINSDGSEAEMCGNGARCVATYIQKIKKPSKKLFSIETMAGIIQASVIKNAATVKLSEPKGYQNSMTITINKRKMTVSHIDTGVPHTIVFVDKLNTIPVKKIGEAVRFHRKFQPRGTNVNFVEQITSSLVDVRTYERGVEDETKACGTGSVASAIVTYLKANPEVTDKKNASMNVRTRSQEILQITFDIKAGKPVNVWLKGSARFIACGEFYY